MPLIQWTIEGRTNTTDEELAKTVTKIFQSAAVRIQASISLINPDGNVKVVCFSHDFFNPAEEISAMADAVNAETIDVNASAGTISQELADAVKQMSEKK